MVSVDIKHHFFYLLLSLCQTPHSTLPALQTKEVTQNRSNHFWTVGSTFFSSFVFFFFFLFSSFLISIEVQKTFVYFSVLPHGAIAVFLLT